MKKVDNIDSITAHRSRQAKKSADGKKCPGKKTLKTAESKAAAAKAAPAKKTSGDVASVRCVKERGVGDSTTGGKWWQVEVNGGQMKTSNGKLGESGASTTKEYEEEAKATKEAEKLGEDPLAHQH